MQTLTVNITAKVRKVREAGKDYLVAPLTLLVPGVLNGSRGALLYPPEQIANSVKIWNGCPLVVYHPTHNGKNVSARHPGVWDRSGVGQVRNPRISKGKLVAEGWFDAERARRVDPRVYNALMNNERMEISTGLYTVNVPAPAGSVCPVGRPYTHIATDYRADHLAILPDQVGACSLNDGCGLMVANRSARQPGHSPLPFPRSSQGPSWQPLHNAYNPNQERDGHGRWTKGPARPTDTLTRQKAATKALKAVSKAFGKMLGGLGYNQAVETDEILNEVRGVIDSGAGPGEVYQALNLLHTAAMALRDHHHHTEDTTGRYDHKLTNQLSDMLDEVEIARQKFREWRANQITDWQVID